MDSPHEPRVREWMLAIISNGGIERLDDLHVDDIDENWKQRTNWIPASIRAYQLSVMLQSNLGLSVQVVLAFSLLDGTGQTFDSEEEFQNQLDWSPPSLYLFKAGDPSTCPTLSSLIHFRRLSPQRFPPGTKSFLSRWATENGSQRRSVFVEA